MATQKRYVRSFIDRLGFMRSLGDKVPPELPEGALKSYEQRGMVEELDDEDPIAVSGDARAQNVLDSSAAIKRQRELVMQAIDNKTRKPGKRPVPALSDGESSANPLLAESIGKAVEAVEKIIKQLAKAAAAKKPAIQRRLDRAQDKRDKLRDSALDELNRIVITATDVVVTCDKLADQMTDDGDDDKVAEKIGALLSAERQKLITQSALMELVIEWLPAATWLEKSQLDVALADSGVVLDGIERHIADGLAAARAAVELLEDELSEAGEEDDRPAIETSLAAARDLVEAYEG